MLSRGLCLYSGVFPLLRLSPLSLSLSLSLSLVIFDISVYILLTRCLHQSHNTFIPLKMDPEPSLSSWQDHLQDESLMPAADDDFTNFLEFGMPFSPQQHQQQQQQRQSLPPRSVPGNPSVAAPDQFVRMDTDDPTAASLHLHTENTSGHDVSSQQGPPSSGLSMPSYSATTAVMTPGFYSQAQQPSHFQDHQHLPQQQPQEPSQQPASSHYHIPNGQTIIPPTPNSIELHGNAARYPQRVDEYEQVRTNSPA